MRLGLLTACLPAEPLEEVAAGGHPRLPGTGDRRLEASAVAYYENNLHHDPRTREALRGHVDRSPWASGWWRYRVPGLGEVDWRRVVDTLHEAGYDGVVSVEHEDPVWSGDPQRVWQGLVIAERTLRPLVVV